MELQVADREIIFAKPVQSHAYPSEIVRQSQTMPDECIDEARNGDHIDHHNHDFLIQMYQKISENHEVTSIDLANLDSMTYPLMLALQIDE